MLHLCVFGEGTKIGLAAKPDFLPSMEERRSMVLFSARTLPLSAQVLRPLGEPPFHRSGGVCAGSSRPPRAEPIP